MLWRFIIAGMGCNMGGGEESIESLKQALLSEKTKNRQLSTHCHYLSAFLYELKEAFLYKNAYAYEKKAEKILAQTPKESLISMEIIAIEKLMSFINRSERDNIDVRESIDDYLDKLTNNS